MKHFSCERGAALLEMAIVVPVLLFVVAGIAESGLLFRNYEVAVNAAREGARLAVLPGAETNDYATTRFRVNTYLTEAKLTGPDDPTPPTITIAAEGISIGTGVTAGGVRVTVTNQYHCLLLGPIVGLFNGTFTDAITYRASALMRTQVAAVGL